MRLKKAKDYENEIVRLKAMMILARQNELAHKTSNAVMLRLDSVMKQHKCRITLQEMKFIVGPIYNFEKNNNKRAK